MRAWVGRAVPTATLVPATLVPCLVATGRTHPCTLASQVIKQPQPLYRDPATTWSNGYEPR